MPRESVAIPIPIDLMLRLCQAIREMQQQGAMYTDATLMHDLEALLQTWA